ncbi:ABC transporter permease subunit [Streptomyces camelliae]|uniref:ABC transporter permease subunit n=1 Tax=Streptomyces camelliae TaxID=3004093 RepID=A0ABY7NUP0_9ACTN|nr:ABC transporter permease subunit [Streptomyces sp. HUAS 2-6]WBO61785.1 ABC transporter permease subunit [Streptomyces sp. HUAS 2-6]
MSANGLRRAVHAEWTKLRTETGHAWLLLGLVAVTASVSAAVVATTRCPARGCGTDPVRLSLTGVTLGQAIAAVLAVQVIGHEYGTGLIHTTLAAVPRRTTVLTAKAAVLSGAVCTAGTLAVLASALAGRRLLPDNGFTPAHGYAALSLADGPTLRAVAGSAIYLVLVALLALGVAAAVRDAAAAMGVVLGLLYLFPLLSHLVTDPQLRRHLAQIGPMPAGLAVQATTDLRHLPIGPWAGLGVLALWAAGALLIGGTVLRLRDA